MNETTTTTTTAIVVEERTINDIYEQNIQIIDIFTIILGVLLAIMVLNMK